MEQVNEVLEHGGWNSTFGHSFHVRGASYYLAQKVDPEMVRIAGRWRSLTYETYTRGFEQVISLCSGELVLLLLASGARFPAAQRCMVRLSTAFVVEDPVAREVSSLSHLSHQRQCNVGRLTGTRGSGKLTSKSTSGAAFFSTAHSESRKNTSMRGGGSVAHTCGMDFAR